MTKLAHEKHPYYPNDWLDRATAETLLGRERIWSRLSMTRCKREGIEVSSTGHIRKVSLESYIRREKSNDQDS